MGRAISQAKEMLPLEIGRAISRAEGKRKAETLPSEIIHAISRAKGKRELRHELQELARIHLPRKGAKGAKKFSH